VSPSPNEIANARLDAMLHANSHEEIRAIMSMTEDDVAALARGEQPDGGDDSGDDLDAARLLDMVPEDGEPLTDTVRRHARVYRTLQGAGLSVEQTRAVMCRAADALRPYCRTGRGARPVRYDKRGDKTDAGRWITIGAVEGPDGKRQGGGSADDDTGREPWDTDDEPIPFARRRGPRRG